MLQPNDRWNILNAAAAAVAINMTNPYVGILAVKLGADNLQLGYLSSLPNLFSVVAVLGVAAAVARARQKQRLIATIFLIGRAAALGTAAVPSMPEGMRVWGLILFWTLTVFPTSAAGTALQSFLADVFPGSAARAQAFAARNAWSTGAGMVVVLVTGWLLDNLFPQPLGYQIIFAASFLFALFEVYCFMRLREPQQAPPESRGNPSTPARVPEAVGLASYWKVFQHKPFASFLLCSIPFHFTWQMAWPLFTRFQVTELQISNTVLSLTTVASSLAMVLSFPWWARWAERKGNRRMLAQAAFQLALAPILTALVPNSTWLVILNLFTGIGVAGIQLLILNNQLDLSPAEQRPIFLAVHSALVAVSASIAPMVGALMMETWPIRQGLMIATVFRAATALLFYLWVFRPWKKAGDRAVRVESTAHEG